MNFNPRALAKSRVNSFLESSYNPTDTVFDGMESKELWIDLRY